MAKEADTTSTPETGMNVDATDQIANLLIGEDEVVDEVDTDEVETDEATDQKAETDDESDDVDETTNEDSTEEVEESEETTESDEGESDVTWAGVLGVGDDQVILDENGEFKAVKVKIDGEEAEVGMKDLIAGYQTNQHLTNTGRQLSEQKKEFESIRDKSVNEYKTRLEDTVKLTEVLHNRLMGDFQNTNWDQLRVENPGEYAAKMTDFNRRQQEIQQIYGAINQERDYAQKQAEQARMEKDNAYLKQSIEKMIEQNPEWKEPEKLKQDFNVMSDFVQDTYGFTEDEFNEVKDHRLIQLVQDARKYREGLKTVETKKVKAKVPQVQKTVGAKPAKKVSKLDSLTKRAKAAKGGEKRDLQSSAIAQILVNGE